MKIAKSKLKKNRRYYLPGIMRGVVGFNARNKCLNGNPELTAKQIKAFSILRNEYGYVQQLEIS